ncbi:vomeronasal type-2 receptor 26-like [Xenopus laevis]|uniref:Vomeronasal type-2 receptor 26-like n=1 Tax=Xenopus laevis TaxID=8355 RepID=A0A8J1KU50_XENLA|nr:vomeronasal type-2 receptor 26-like [Xenopus laevis]
MLILTVLLQIFPAASGVSHYSSPGCGLWKNNYSNTFQDGDFIVGAVLQLSDFHWRFTPSPIQYQTNIICMSLSSPGFPPLKMKQSYIAIRVSYGTTDPIYNDRIQFPSFYRTVPNEVSEMDGIVQMLKHFGWKWVGLIISDSESGERALDRIRKGIESYGGCVAFSIFLMEKVYFYLLLNLKTLSDTINKEGVDVIVLVLTPMHINVIIRLFSLRQVKRKIWLTSSFFPTVIHFIDGNVKTLLNGTLSLSDQGGEIPGFETFFYRMTPINYPNDDVITTIWETLHGCSFTDFLKTNTSVPVQKCSGNESLNNEVLSTFGKFDFRIGYQVYTAVYALAHALHNLLSVQTPTHHLEPAGSLNDKFKPWKLNSFIHNVTYKTPSGNILFFKDNGDPPARFDIVKWFFLNDDSVLRSKVGSFDESNKQNYLYINSSANLWSPFFTEIPRSLCSDPCSPGYRKSKIEGEPPCCYDCVQCGDGEMSNTTDAMTCVKCPEDQKSNEQKTDCVPKALNYLSYVDTLGVSLTSTAIFLFITTSAVLGIFVKYWDTPIVKASNRNLSCLLLISLMLCFLCTLLFIGHPTKIFCLVQQVAFGVIFTISVSSVLAKTLTVIIAFNATKPGSKLKKYVGFKLSILVVFVCFLGESIISVVWMASSPPFPDVDTYSEADTIILLCNQGSIIFIFSIIGYIGALAVMSFIAAFLAKDFPDRFNEAKNITFSMLVFCSVWVTFVPAYLSSKGSRMVAVEIFAILFSSAGLLTCIFAPKCYIIFLRPELNIREIRVRIT